MTFTAQQAKDLMAFVEEHYPTAVPFFALCLFAGIRPCLRTGEIRGTEVREELVRLRDIVGDSVVKRVGAVGPSRGTILPQLGLRAVAQLLPALLEPPHHALPRA